MVQWLGLTTTGPGLTPGQGTKTHKLNAVGKNRERERTRLSKWEGRVLFQIRGKRNPMIWHQLLSFRKEEEVETFLFQEG